MQAIKFFSIVSILAITACASISDIENAQTQISLLNTQITTLNTSITNTKSIADKANAQAVNAFATDERVSQELLKDNAEIESMYTRHCGGPEKTTQKKLMKKSRHPALR